MQSTRNGIFQNLVSLMLQRNTILLLSSVKKIQRTETIIEQDVLRCIVTEETLKEYILKLNRKKAINMYMQKFKTYSLSTMCMSILLSMMIIGMAYNLQLDVM